MAPALELVAALMQTMAQKLMPHQQVSMARPGVSSSVDFPPGPFLDVALRLANDPLRCIEDLKSEYGPVVGFRLISRPVVLVASPPHAREVFITNNDAFVKAGTAFFPSTSITGNGLVNSDGDSWKRQRRLSNPAFRKGAIESYANAIVDRTAEMLERKWRDGGVRDVHADISDLTTRIVASSLFGGTAGHHQMDEVGTLIGTTFNYFTRRGTAMLMLPEWIPTPDNLQYLSSVKKLDELVYSLIAERRRTLTSKKSIVGSTADLLTRLLQARDEDGSGMDDKILRDELMTFLIAGQETSSTLLTWALVMLAHNPKTQHFMYNECMEVLGDRSPTYFDISKLRYVEAFIWETLRLMPPAFIVGRCAREDTRLGSWGLPAGTTVLVSPYLLHRDPAHWPRAKEFDPERWLPGGSAVNHAENDSFWPFGGGPRNCIGMGFAMMEVAVVLAMVVSEFKVQKVSGEPIPEPEAMITLRPGSRVDLVLTKRKTKRSASTVHAGNPGEATEVDRTVVFAH